MSLPEYAIKRRVTTVMVFVGIVFLGCVALLDLPQELFPRINFPQVTIVTDYVNAAPEEIETLITRPLEEAISSVSGLRRLESVSREGKSLITVSFNWSQDIDFAALAVREKIDLVKERLPKESEDPVVLKFDPLSRPILILSVTGKMPAVELKQLSERTLRDNLEKVEGVASVTVAGGLDREIQVDLDQGQLQASAVSILQVIDSLDTANISYPAGSIKKGLYEYLIRTVGEFRNVEEIGFTVIKAIAKERGFQRDSGFVEKGAQGPRSTLDTEREGKERGIQEKRLVLLNDIGAVRDAFHERTSISRYNSKENVSLSIQKQATANTVQLVDKIKRELAFLNDEIESRGAKVQIIYDHSAFIKKAVASTRDAAIQGGLLAAVILFLFFKDPLTSFIVALSIPISVLGTFFLLKLQGITLNTMSLGGLALGSGMIVDNSIVVIENIFRLREQGVPKEEASVRGANEVFWPIVSSTLTTEAVFIPLILFVPGVAGQLFRDLCWSVVHSLNISFLVSAWLIPMAALYIQPKQTKREKPKLEKNLQNFFRNQSIGVQNGTMLALVGAAVGFFLIGMLIFQTLDTEVIPKVDQGQFLIKVNLPVGSRIEATDDVVKIIEDKLRQIPEIENSQVEIGSASSAKSGEVKLETLRISQALIMVSLKEKRKRSSHAVLTELRQSLEKADLSKVSIEYILQENEFAFAAAGGKPIVIEVKGYDLEVLKSLTDEVERRLASISGVVEILNDSGERSPETKIEIDKKKASLYAISARDISLTAKAAIDGAVATKYKEAGHEVDVRVKLRRQDRDDMSRLGDLLIHSDSLEISVPIKAVAQVKSGFGPSEIKRKDQIRTVTVSAAVQKTYKENDVLDKVANEISQIEVPQNYNVRALGKAEEVKDAFRRIAFATILALVLNYMIMAAQFESFVQPFVIMFTVPLAIIGVAIALLVTGTSVSVISLLGILILAGTVVNNAIVLIDFINQQRIAGVELVEAAIESAFTRFRAIMMSALTSIVGLIPLALGLGEGAELQAPLAIAVIGGLLSGTFLTLCIIPCVYVLVVRLIDRILNGPYLDDSEANLL